MRSKESQAGLRRGELCVSRFTRRPGCEQAQSGRFLRRSERAAEELGILRPRESGVETIVRRPLLCARGPFFSSLAIRATGSAEGHTKEASPDPPRALNPSALDAFVSAGSGGSVMASSSGTDVIQVTNVSPSASSEQMRTLFGFLGKIEELRLFPPE